MGCGGSKTEEPIAVVDNNAELKIVVLGVGGVGMYLMIIKK
jgi:tRNA A37 threonylcarbamoyladenosine dehydratase